MQNEFDYRKYLNLISAHKRLFAITALTVMTGVAVLSYLLPKKYEVRCTLFIEKNVLNELLRGTTERSEMEDALKGFNYSIKSRSLFTKVINDLDLNLGNKSDVQLDAVIMGLQKNTDCKLNKEDGLITISFTDNNPRFARDFVNALVRRYIEQNLSAKREESYGATNFISDQIASVKEKLDKSEAQIAKLRTEKGAALTVEPTTVQTEINTAQQRLDELILRRSQLEAARNQLRSNNPARTRLAALQRRLEELRVEYTDNYPEVQKVKSDIEAARSEIGRVSGGSGSAVSDPQELTRVEAELNAVRNSEANQRALLANSRGLLRANPSAKTELEKLEQERNSYRAMYEQLMARHGQAEMSKQMAVQDKSTTYRIVDPAVMPLTPVSPNRVRIILLGIVAGIAGGLGMILAIDYFDNSVKMVSSLKTLGLPVMAVIPLMKSDNEIQIERNKDLRLYFLSAFWFSVILAVLLMEALHLSLLDRMMSDLLSSQLTAQLTGWLR